MRDPAGTAHTHRLTSPCDGLLVPCRVLLLGVDLN